MKNVTSKTINQKKKKRERKEPRNQKQRLLQIPPQPQTPPVLANPSTAPQKSAPPLPPPPPKGMRAGLAKVRRVLAVVEFYHSLMRRDSRWDYDASTTEVGKTRATPPVAGETNQRRKRRTSGGGDEPAVRETNERRGSNAVIEE
ncbi:hypothetical protein ACOSP7_006052 [Xanthoceras sorbifolium]